MAEETTPNPAAGDATTPAVAKEHAPSTEEAQPTDLPSGNQPNPPEEDITDKPQADAVAPKGKKPAKAAADKPAAEAGEKPAGKAAKKEKAPAVEDKPFQEFVEQDYIPALKTALAKEGVQDLQLSLQQQKIPIPGMASAGECWQLKGTWQGGDREFRVYFTKDDIQGPRAFSYAVNGSRPSTLEPFLIDERKITLDLLVFGVVQRLNAQKWLVLN